MVNFLSKIFIKNYKDVQNPMVREAYGKLASIAGILSNILLFVFKLIIGVISSSISIIADSINNLSDFVSSIVTLVGFKLSSKPADKEHPYGHQRIEYITGLIISLFVIVLGASLFMSSIDKVVSYTKEEVNKTFIYISIVILVSSILIKLWQSLFYLKISKRINSVALEATSKDSRNDVLSTLLILIGNIVILITGSLSFSLDGVLGIIVSLFIVISGISLIKETTTPLIGENNSNSINQIIETIKLNSIVLAYHDPMCHTYGPTNCYMTIHIEVDASLNIIDIHEEIDKLEKEIKQKYGVILTCHMDPVRLHDAATNEMRNTTACIVKDIDPILSIHDFRITKRDGLEVLIFELGVPYKYKLTDEEIISRVNQALKTKGYLYLTDIDIDHE